MRIVNYIGLPKITVIIAYVAFAAAIVVVEEVAIARETYLETRKMQAMTNIMTRVRTAEIVLRMKTQAIF